MIIGLLLVHLTHFLTDVMAGRGTHRLIDIIFFCFDTSRRNSVKFFSAHRFRSISCSRLCFVMQILRRNSAMVLINRSALICR